jgi:hypothetical protein
MISKSILNCFFISVMLVSKTTVAQVPNILNYQGRIAVRGVNFDGTGQFKFALVDGGTTTTPATRTATGAAVITSGFVTSITSTDGGAGYSSAPLVTITGGGGNGATATATLSGGAVSGFSITTPGSGYTSPPTITVNDPPPAIPMTGYATYWSNDGTSVMGSEPLSAVTLPIVRGLFSAPIGDSSVTNMSEIPDNIFDNSDMHLRIWFNDGDKGWQQVGNDVRILPSAFSVKSSRSGKLVLRDHSLVWMRTGHFSASDGTWPSLNGDNFAGWRLPVYMRGQSSNASSWFQGFLDLPLGFAGEIVGLTVDCEAKIIQFTKGADVSVILQRFDIDQTVDTILFNKQGEWNRDVFETLQSIKVDPTKQYQLLIRVAEINVGQAVMAECWLHSITLKINQIISE